MKHCLSKKVLPLTLKDLKKLQKEYRIKKSSVFQFTSFQFLSITARVLKTTTTELKLSDQTSTLVVEFHPTLLRKAVDPQAGVYYCIHFMPKKNPMISKEQQEFVMFDIVGMRKVCPHEITLHLANVIQQKAEREAAMQKEKEREEKYKEEVRKGMKGEKKQEGGDETNLSKLNSSNNDNQSTKSKKINGEYEITKFLRQLGREFDKETICDHFGDKYTVKEVEKILEKLSDKGAIMDLGLVYEWVMADE